MAASLLCDVVSSAMEEYIISICNSLMNCSYMVAIYNTVILFVYPCVDIAISEI